MVVTAVTPDGVRRGPDGLIVEEPMTIQLDGNVVSTTMRTPGHDFELAAGFCHTEGLLTDFPVTGVRYCATSGAAESEFNVVSVDTAGRAPIPDTAPRNDVIELWLVRQRAARRHVRPAGAAAGDRSDAARAARPGAHLVRRPAAPVRRDRCRPRRGRVRPRRRGLARPGRRRTPQRGRQDRRGDAARRPLPAIGLGLFVSGRASVEMVQKAWAAGFGTLVAVSAPTALAVDAARRANLLLAGFVRGDRFNIYAPERLARPGSRSLRRMRMETGVCVLHLFCNAGRRLDREAMRRAIDAAESHECQVITASILGHKADVAVMALGADVRALRELQTGLQRAGLDVVDSYLSITEVSEYAKGLPEHMLRDRLYPQLPPDGKPAFCFYPMSKRREAHANWYATPFDERNDMMMEHGTSGRKFAGRVVQLVTASTGLDDFEWGVTLFADEPRRGQGRRLHLRFDKGSALYGEFGELLRRLSRRCRAVLRPSSPSLTSRPAWRASRHLLRRASESRRLRTATSRAWSMPSSSKPNASNERSHESPVVVDSSTSPDEPL